MESKAGLKGEGAGGTDRGARIHRLAEAIAVVALIGAIATANYRFIAHDRSDYAVVDADHYMNRAFQIYDSLRRGAGWSSFDTGHHLYTPLNWMLGALWMLGTERSAVSLRLYSATWLPFGLLYVYLLGRLFLGPWAALLAVFLGGTQSLVLETSRYFLQDAPQICLLPACLYHAARSEGFRRGGHTAATLLVTLLATMMKWQSVAMLSLPYLAHCIKGWRSLGRESPRRLAVALGWQFGLCAAVAAAAYACRPDLFEILAAANTKLRTSEFSFALTRPFHDSWGGLPYALAYAFMGWIRLLERVAWPMASLFAVGGVAGAWRLRGSGRMAAFLSIPLLFLGTNIVVVWAGAHLEFERYFAARVALYGIPIVATAGLVRRRGLRWSLLGALSAYAIVGFAGPRVAPVAFDSPPRCHLTHLRIKGLAKEDYPLVVTRLWDEPAQRPTVNPSGPALKAALNKALAENPRLRRPARVACLCSDQMGDNTIFEYSQMSDDEKRFYLAKNPVDVITGDFLLTVVPAVPGAWNLPRRLMVPMPESMYCAIVTALGSPSMLERLGLRQIETIGLPLGRTLGLYQKFRERSEAETLAEAVALHETVVLPDSARTLPSDMAKWLEEAGETAAAAAFRRVAQAGAPYGSSGAAGDLPSGGGPERSLDRLRRWTAAYDSDLEKGDSETILAVATSEPPAGPGMLATSLTPVFRIDREKALEMAKQGVSEFATHNETWQAIISLLPYGLPFDETIAQTGQTLAVNYFERYPIPTDAIVAGRMVGKAGYPQFIHKRLARLELLKRDQPAGVNTLAQEAAFSLIEGGPPEEREAGLRTAIGLAGWTYSEKLDQHLRFLLGRDLLTRGRAKEGIGFLKSGGMEGVEALLDWSRLNETAKAYPRRLRWALGVENPQYLSGSDPIRVKALCGLFLEERASAHKAFAAMNQTSLREEWPYFSQILSLEDNDGLKALQETCDDARENFYNETRPDLHAWTIGEELTRRGAPLRRKPAAPALTGEERAALDGLSRGRGIADLIEPDSTPPPETGAISGEALFRWIPKTPAVARQAAGAELALVTISLSFPTTTTLYVRARCAKRGYSPLLQKIKVEGQPESDFGTTGWIALGEAYVLGDARPATMEFLLQPPRHIHSIRISTSAEFPNGSGNAKGPAPDPAPSLEIHELAAALARAVGSEASGGSERGG